MLKDVTNLNEKHQREEWGAGEEGGDEETSVVAQPVEDERREDGAHDNAQLLNAVIPFMYRKTDMLRWLLQLSFILWLSSEPF